MPPTKLSTESFDDYGNTQGISIVIQVPTATTFTIPFIPFDCTIVSASFVMSSGTATFKVQINDGSATDVTGLTGLNASTTAGSANATAANLVAEGNHIQIVVTSPASTPENLSIMLKVIKTKD